MTLTTFDVTLGLKNAWKCVTIYDISKNSFFLISLAAALTLQGAIRKILQLQ